MNEMNEGWMDAHLHLQQWLDAREVGVNEVEGLLGKWREAGIGRWVINGTRLADWDEVASLAAASDGMITPSFGMHPWWVGEMGEDDGWVVSLEERLRAWPQAGVGECGLDRWVRGADVDLQRRVLLPQLVLAREMNRPLSIHCLQAWGEWRQVLASEPVPERGFLLHAFGGSPELAVEMERAGAYFSFNSYFMHERKGKVREAFRRVSLERLLVETDAPAMAPPGGYWHEGAEIGKVNHPLNLLPAYQALAEIRGMGVNELRRQVAANFTRFFGGCGKK